MSKYIEAEWLIARIPSEEMIAKMAVAQAPTIDVVHCRECKYEDDCSWSNSGFCGFGEREGE